MLWAGQLCANYTEAHVTGADARVVVERDGKTTVTLAIAYRVAAGTVRSIALTGFEDGWQLHEEAKVTSGDGHAFGARVARDDKDVVHVSIDDPKGLKRGDYKVELTYDGSIVGRVVRDGAFDRVRFALPPMREGIDSARVVLDLPSAPTEPRAAPDALGEDAPNDAVTDIVTLRRGTERDELELVRPHVAKAEAATFYARVDPKALSLVNDPALRAPERAPSAPSAPSEDTPLAVWIVVAASALGLFAIALAKTRARSAMGLVPIPPSARAALAAIAFGSGVRAETSGRLVLGAALVACAMPLLASRGLAASRKVRGPAAWVATNPKDAFAEVSSRADFLDATTRRGALVLAFVALCAVVAARLVSASGAAYLVAIDALVLVPIFFTGTSLQLPPSPDREARALAPLARALGALEPTPYVRIARDGSTEETRLRVLPEAAMPGTLGIEIGVAWEGRGPWLASFDVLVRAADATFASAKMTTAFPTKRALPGRTPEERVFRFEPDGPSIASCAAKVRELVATLRDRRVAIATDRDRDGTAPNAERRLPPNRRPVSRSITQEAAA